MIFLPVVQVYYDEALKSGFEEKNACAVESETPQFFFLSTESSLGSYTTGSSESGW